MFILMQPQLKVCTISKQQIMAVAQLKAILVTFNNVSMKITIIFESIRTLKDNEIGVVSYILQLEVKT